jgi:hypothetical protein
VDIRHARCDGEKKNLLETIDKLRTENTALVDQLARVNKQSVAEATFARDESKQKHSIKGEEETCFFGKGPASSFKQQKKSSMVFSVVQSPEKIEKSPEY